MQNDWHSTTRHWLRRLRFSLLAIAFVLGWEVYKRHQAGIANDWRTLLYIVGAMLSVVLAMSGRELKRRDD